MICDKFGNFALNGRAACSQAKLGRIHATGRVASPQGRLIDIQKLQLMNAMISDIAYLQHNFLGQFLLQVQVPLLRVGGLKIL